MSIKFFSKLSLVAITAGVALSGMASSASAGGFLAGTFERIGQKQPKIVHGGIMGPCGCTSICIVDRNGRVLSTMPNWAQPSETDPWIIVN